MSNRDTVPCMKRLNMLIPIHLHEMLSIRAIRNHTTKQGQLINDLAYYYATEQEFKKLAAEKLKREDQRNDKG